MNLCSFIILALLVKLKLTNSFDHWVQSWIQASANPQLTQILIQFTKLASPTATVIWVLIFSSILIFRHKIKDAAYIVTTFSCGGIFLSVVKLLIARPRPVMRIVQENTYSFPSGHTFGVILLALTICSLIAPLFPKTKNFIYMLAIAFAIFIPFSRIYLLVHYPTDILGGIFFAYFWWYFCQHLLQIKNRRGGF